MATIERETTQPPESRKTYKKITARQFFNVAFSYLGEPRIPKPPQPLTMQAMLAREAFMMDQRNVRINQGNFSTVPNRNGSFIDWINSPSTHFNELIGEGVRLHTVPSAGPHYDGWSYKWDGDVAVNVNARRGRPRQAALGLLSAEVYRDKKTGFLPNKSRLRTVEQGDAIFLMPERNLYMHPDFSSYTQPPLKSWAAWDTYQSFINQGMHEEGRQFLEEIYGTAEKGNYTGLQGECAYFLKHRQNSETDDLIFNTYMNETGRDYDSALGPHIKILPGKGRIAGLVNSAIVWRYYNGIPKLKDKFNNRRFKGFNHTIAALGKDPEGERLDWLPERVRRFYAVNDAMFNALHVINLHYTAKVARELDREEEAVRYEKLASSTSQKITERMWDENTGFFYNLDKNGNQIPVKSITGLFPLLIESLPVHQVRALLEKLNDKEWFATEFPIPSHPTNSPNYDPHYFRKEGANWKGPVWVHMNHFIVEEGLVPQAGRFLNVQSHEYDPNLGLELLETAEHIVKQTHMLLASNELVYEQYNPEGRKRTIFRRAIRAGKGQRVEEFMEPNIGLHFDRLEKLKEELALAA